MKNLIAPAALAIAFAAPAFADDWSARKHFAESENSAAERNLPNIVDTDNVVAKARLKGMLDEQKEAVLAPDANAISRTEEAQTEAYISQFSNSAAEIEG